MLCMFHCKNLNFLFKKTSTISHSFSKSGWLFEKCKYNCRNLYISLPSYLRPLSCMRRESNVKFTVTLPTWNAVNWTFPPRSWPWEDLFGTRVITILLSRRGEGSSAFSDASHCPRGDRQLHLMQQSDLNPSKAQAQLLWKILWQWNLLDKDKRISLFRIVTKTCRTIQNRFSLCLQWCKWPYGRPGISILSWFSTDVLQLSFKAAVLHNGNVKPLVPVAHPVAGERVVVKYVTLTKCS